MRLLFSLFLALVIAPVFAQTPASPIASSQQAASPGYTPPLFNARARNVVLDAVVTDKAGNVVSGLTRDEFVVREDGSPQQIQSFDAVTSGDSIENATPHTILLVDEMNTRFQDMAYARYSVNRLLGHDGTKLEQPTALYMLGNDGLHVLQNYTRDPAAIDAALRSHRAVLPWRVQHNVYLALERISISMTALQQIALANTGVPGRKNVVWISPGFPILSAWQIGPDDEKVLFDSLRHLSDQLLKARISIYSVDPRGVQGEFLPSGIATNNLAFAAYLNGLAQPQDVAFGDLAIQTLATQTGGHAFYGRNDVDREIARSLEEGNTYYTLSYAPANHDFHGEFRKLKISIVNRPDLKVQTRDGYYAMPDDDDNADSKRNLRGLALSLLTSIPFNGVPIPISFMRVTNSAAPSVNVRFAVPVDALTWSPDANGRLDAQVTVAAAGKDKHGAWKARLVRVYSVRLPDGTSPSANAQTSLKFNIPYPHPGGIRFIVRDDASGHIGSSEITPNPGSISGS